MSTEEQKNLPQSAFNRRRAPAEPLVCDECQGDIDANTLYFWHGDFRYILDRHNICPACYLRHPDDDGFVYKVHRDGGTAWRRRGDASWEYYKSWDTAVWTASIRTTRSHTQMEQEGVHVYCTKADARKTIERAGGTWPEEDGWVYKRSVTRASVWRRRSGGEWQYLHPKPPVWAPSLDDPSVHDKKEKKGVDIYCTEADARKIVEDAGGTWPEEQPQSNHEPEPANRESGEWPKWAVGGHCFGPHVQIARGTEPHGTYQYVCTGSSRHRESGAIWRQLIEAGYAREVALPEAYAYAQKHNIPWPAEWERPEEEPADTTEWQASYHDKPEQPEPVTPNGKDVPMQTIKLPRFKKRVKCRKCKRDMLPNNSKTDASQLHLFCPYCGQTEAVMPMADAEHGFARKAEKFLAWTLPLWATRQAAKLAGAWPFNPERMLAVGVMCAAMSWEPSRTVVLEGTRSLWQAPIEWAQAAWEVLANTPYESVWGLVATIAVTATAGLLVTRERG